MPAPPVPYELLSWRCPATCLDFSTTADVPPIEGVVGQDDGTAALRFGLAIDAHGQNVYVRGVHGTGRMTLVRESLRTLQPTTRPAPDRCYVHDFSRPDSPRLLSPPAGTAPALRERMDEFVRFVLEDLSDLVHTEGLRVRTHEVESQADREVAGLSDPFEKALQTASLALVSLEGEQATQTAIIPLLEGEPVTFDVLEERVNEGKFDIAHFRRLRNDADRLAGQLERVSAQVVKVRRRASRTVRRLHEHEATRVLTDSVADVPRKWPVVNGWLDEVVVDATRSLSRFEEHQELAARYRVNVLVSRQADASRPVIIENVPTVQNLLGSIEGTSMAEGSEPAPHLGIHAGALVRADGGTLVLNVRDVLNEPMAWSALMRTLRTGEVELSPADASQSTLRTSLVKPAAIPIHVKVVLIGTPEVWYALDDQDPEFPHLFKVLVDIDDVLPRDVTGIAYYGRVVARIARDEGLPPFTSAAVGSLVEAGARECGQGGKLTARFGRIADLAREAAFLARGRGVTFVDRDDVDRALLAGRRRADLPGRKFREAIGESRIPIRSSGEEIGEVNGLAVMEAGPFAYGFPIRITATVGPGTAGTIHIEREAELSGQIHTKAFLIVRGLLRQLLRTRHPLVFDASITHEQSYGGVDGDSASAAEFCCLLSALTGQPVRQTLAVTGAIDQHGNVMPVGAVNEKIEGFFDVCAVRGLQPGNGVIVPRANAEDLQLRRDVVHACRAGRFSIWTADRIEEVIELLFGLTAGIADGDGRFAEGTLLARAVARAEELWRAADRPDRVAQPRTEQG